MQPLPSKETILEAVSAYLRGASKSPDPDRFGLRLAASLTAMVGRELALSGPSRFEEEEMVKRIRHQDDWLALLPEVRADLADQLTIIAPRFELGDEVEQ